MQGWDFIAAHVAHKSTIPKERASQGCTATGLEMALLLLQLSAPSPTSRLRNIAFQH